MTPQSDASLASGQRRDYLQPASFSSAFVTTEAATAPTGPAAVGDGTWIHNGNGDWSLASNWQGDLIADGAGAIAHFDTLNLTTDVSVTLDSSRTVGQLLIGDTDGTNHYT